MILLLAILIFVPWTDGTSTDEIKNKTKRTLSHELYNYGETKPIYVYSDNLGSHSTSRELPNLSSGTKSLTLVSAPQVLKVYDQQVSPKVVPQQFLYEYPVSTNTVPNVQVRHLVQPLSNFNQDLATQNSQIPDYKEQLSPTNGQSFVPSETVVLPIQQRQNAALIPSNNGQTYSSIRFHPIHNAQTAPKKYFYVNGKTFYDQNNLPYLHQNINQPQPNPLLVAPHQHLQYYPQQRSERPQIINYVNRHHTPRQNLNTQANVSPIIYSRPSAPPKKQLPPITSSLTVPHKNNEQSEQEDEEKVAPVKEKDENEENEEKSNDQEEDFEQHDQNPIFNKYSFDDYEENDHHDYRDHKEAQDDEDEEDNRRGSSKRVASKKYPRKYSKGGKHSSDYYKHNDSDSKHDHPEGKSNHKSNRRPKMVYKSVKYSREINNKPKSDSIEGRYSENVPVTHKHNRVFKEKWYISKTDENLETK